MANGFKTVSYSVKQNRNGVTAIVCGYECLGRTEKQAIENAGAKYGRERYGDKFSTAHFHPNERSLHIHHS